MECTKLYKADNVIYTDRRNEDRELILRWHDNQHAAILVWCLYVSNCIFCISFSTCKRRVSYSFAYCCAALHTIINMLWGRCRATMLPSSGSLHHLQLNVSDSFPTTALSIEFPFLLRILLKIILLSFHLVTTTTVIFSGYLHTSTHSDSYL